MITRGALGWRTAEFVTDVARDECVARLMPPAGTGGGAVPAAAPRAPRIDCRIEGDELVVWTSWFRRRARTPRETVSYWRFEPLGPRTLVWLRVRLVRFRQMFFTLWAAIAMALPLIMVAMAVDRGAPWFIVLITAVMGGLFVWLAAMILFSREGTLHEMRGWSEFARRELAARPLEPAERGLRGLR